MERTTAPSLAAIRSNALATALALALGVSTSVATATPDAMQPPNGFRQVGGDAGAQMRRWLAEHPDIAQAQMKNVTGGATLQVINCNDSGSGSLRDTVAGAASGDTVDMSELSCSLIALNGQLIIPQQTLDLRGNGTTTITNVNPGDGLIQHLGTGGLDLSALILSGGVREGSQGREGGGCVLSHGTVQLTNATLENCKAINHSGIATGGAIFADADVEMTYSVITGAEAIADGAAGNARGGAIYTLGGLLMKYSSIESSEASATNLSQGGAVWAQDKTTISHSTISGNDAQNVGGLVVTSSNPATDILIEDSTIFLNDSSGHPDLDVCGSGAFLRTPGDITIENSTISLNRSFDPLGVDGGGAGVCFEQGANSITLDSNIISGNKYWDPTPQVHPSDVFFNAEGSTILTISGTNNLIGQIFVDGFFTHAPWIRDNIEPTLSAFGDHGGPTKTMALSTGSWAFNLGSYEEDGQFDPNTDQRGMPREVGAGVDLGAFESDALFIGRFEDSPTSL